MKKYKYKYRVIVSNNNNEIMVCHLFENLENAIICFQEFHTRYSEYDNIYIKANKI